MGDSYPSRSEYQKNKKDGQRRTTIVSKLAIRTILFLMICGLLLTGIFGFTAMSYVKSAPKLNPELLGSPQSSTIYDMNNKKVMDVAGEEYRKIVPLEDIPKTVQNAFLAVEDARFWEHQGIDMKRVAGAVAANVTEGFGAEGASTITQQLVKISFLTPEKTMERKVQEAYLALKLERKYSKKEILEMYLNKVYFGEGAYGVGTAAEVYFGKSVKDLTVSEAALLAGLPQRPSGYNPFEYPDLAEKRRNTVLALMQKNGWITEKERIEASSIPVKEMLTEKKRKHTYNSFTDRVIEELKEKGFDEDALYTQGLKIYTTLDPKAQKLTEKVLKTDEYINYPDDQFRAGVVLLDTQTGEVRAIGGSREKEESVQRGFNYATHIKRQPGSTAKPIMAYGPVIEKLKWSTYEQIKDEPIELNGKVFKNWNNKFHGNVSMRTALQWSYNIPAIKAMQAAGEKEAQHFAAALGLHLDEVFPSYAIGGFEYGVSPLELAGAYAAFGNNGVFHEPHTVRKIVYPNGKEKNLQPEPVQAMSDYTAYMITDMLKTVVRSGTGEMANIPGLPVAGKTGTNELPDHIHGNGVTDAWFAGYTTRYTAAVWTGYDEITQDSFVQMKDSHNAKLIFKAVMSEMSKGKETPDFKMPSSVEKVTVGNQVELFVKGTKPIKPAISDNPKKTEEKEPVIKDKDEEAGEEDDKEEEEKQEPVKEPVKDSEKKSEKAPEKKPADGNRGDQQTPENPQPKPNNPPKESPVQKDPKPPADKEVPPGNPGNDQGGQGNNKAPVPEPPPATGGEGRKEQGNEGQKSQPQKESPNQG